MLDGRFVRPASALTSTCKLTRLPGSIYQTKSIAHGMNVSVVWHVGVLRYRAQAVPDPMESPKHRIAFLETRVRMCFRIVSVCVRTEGVTFCAEELEALLSGNDYDVPAGSSVTDKTLSSGEGSATNLVSEPGDIAMGDAESMNGGSDDIPVIDLDLSRGMIWTTWPSELPGPESVQLLLVNSLKRTVMWSHEHSRRIEAFFRYYPHADRLFHRSTFMYWLSLPPTHDNFPSAAVLHAICGLGIMYTRQLNPESVSPGTIDETCSARRRLVINSHLSLFLDDDASEKHIELAKSLAEKNMIRGIQLIQNQQGVSCINTRWLALNTAISASYRRVVVLVPCQVDRGVYALCPGSTCLSATRPGPGSNV